MAGKHELEKFEYLFVDIEWNQTPGTNGIEDREPIQIGVVATDESMNLKKTFSRAMRLSSEEKYNPDTLVLSHSTLKSVMQANSEEIVLQKIKMSFPKYKYVVVWTKDMQIPLHRITDSASNGSVFPVVTEHFSASSDHAFL